MNNQEQNIKDILEIVTFIRDTAATREYVDEKLTEKLEEVRTEFDEKLTAVKDEILNRMDMFIGLHQKLELELTAMRSKYERLENMVRMMAKQIDFKLD